MGTVRKVTTEVHHQYAVPKRRFPIFLSRPKVVKDCKKCNEKWLGMPLENHRYVTHYDVRHIAQDIKWPTLYERIKRTSSLEDAFRVEKVLWVALCVFDGYGAQDMPKLTQNVEWIGALDIDTDSFKMVLR